MVDASEEGGYVTLGGLDAVSPSYGDVGDVEQRTVCRRRQWVDVGGRGGGERAALGVSVVNGGKRQSAIDGKVEPCTK